MTANTTKKADTPPINCNENKIEQRDYVFTYLERNDYGGHQSHNPTTATPIWTREKAVSIFIHGPKNTILPDIVSKQGYQLYVNVARILLRKSH